MIRCNHGHGHDVRRRWQKGKGSFEGWKLIICRDHQIILEMKKEAA